MMFYQKYQTRTAWMLTLALLFSFVLPVFPASAVDTETLPIQLISEQPIGEGVVLQTYNKKISGKKSWVYVTKVDLNNPYAQVKPLYGKNGAFTSKQTVGAMAKESGAIAAINADFFNMKKRTPFGMVVDQGEVVSSMARVPAWYSLGILQDQTAVIDNFTYKGKVTTPSGETFPIQGVNKEEYLATGIQSHKDQINLYTPKFGPTSLGSLPGLEDYTEVIVENDIVKDIRVKQPKGASIPADGYVLWGNGSGSNFLKNKFKVGDIVQISSSHISTAGREDILAAMGGSLLLVDNGKALRPYDRWITGKVSRSAVGISQDGKTLYLVAVEGPPNGRGMELEELAITMQELGTYRAANLDGGGSTTMVARKLADTDLSLLNVPAYGIQRQIPTAIGVFNTAPAGDFKDFRIEGPAQVLKGAAAVYQVKGWDEHILPYSINQSDVTWSAIDPLTENKLLGLTTGTQEITASYQGVQHTKKIEVIGASSVDKLFVEPSIVAVNKGESVNFKVKIQTKDGKVLEVSPQGATASVSPELGSIDGFTFTGGQLESKGQMTVNFDGLEVKIPVSVGTISQPFESFDEFQTDLTYTAVPKEIATQGFFTLTKEGEPVYRTGKAVKLQYDFSSAPWDEIRVAYGVLGDKPIPLPGTPIGVGMWVYGDESNHWLRSEIIDANGKVHYMTLAKEISFKGWKYVKGNMPPEAVYPVKMKSIYVVSMPEGAEERPNQGTLYFDEVTLYQPYDPTKVIEPTMLQAGNRFSLGDEMAVSLDIDAQVEPISTIPFYMPGKKPVRTGFKVAYENNQNPKKLTLTPFHWPAGQAVGLYYVNVEKQVLQEIKGTREANGDYTFPMQNLGTYIPYYLESPNPFKDVKSGSWYEKAVVELYREGIVKGMSEDTFAPNTALTRAQFVTLLGNWLGWEADPSQPLDFKDKVPDYAVPAVKTALSKGIVQGFPGKLFKSDEPLTRAQMAVMLYRALQDRGDQLKLEEAKSFEDETTIPEWAKEAVQVMSSKGYIKGIDNSFEPAGQATRAQAAVLIYQINH